MDLDRLIGELETEAARRRAEPGYPHDADARLHFELARRAPTPAAVVRPARARRPGAGGRLADGAELAVPGPRRGARDAP